MKLRNLLKSIFVIMLLFIITGCNEPSVVDIKLSEDNIKQDIDDFNISDLSLTVTYDDNTVNIVNVTNEMLSKEDLDKLNVVGKHDIKINYLDKVITLNINLTNYYEITFILDDKVVNTQTVEHGMDAILPNESTINKEGYTFIGWNHDGKNITEDTIIEGIYQINKYEVKFVLDREVIATQIIEHGKDADLAKVYKEGHIILGWNHDGKNITEEIIIEGTFELEKYTVKFYYNGDLIDTQIVEYGKYAIEPELSLKQLDYFEAWKSILYSPITKDTDIHASVDFIKGGKLLRHKNESKTSISEYLKVSKEILTEDERNLIDSYINNGYEQIDNSRTKEKVDKITVYTKQLIENVGSKYYKDTFERIPGEEKYTEGNGTYEDPYIIDTKGKLIYLSNNTNNGIGRIAYYELRADIDLEGNEWIPIKSFKGYFNGNGYEITNYKINESYKEKNDFTTYIGLFGYNEGIIENLGVKNFDMNFKWECEYEGAGYIYIGGIVGDNYLGQINNCYFIGDIKIDYFKNEYTGEASGYIIFIGGIAGGSDSNNSNINNCYSQVYVDVKYINKNPVSSCISELNHVCIAGIAYGDICRGENNLAICTYTKDMYRCDFSYENTCRWGFNNYYYVKEEKGVRGETTSEDLNSLEFYTNTLGWNEETWDLTNIEFKDGAFLEDHYPKLKRK